MQVAENFCRKISSLPNHVRLQIFKPIELIDCYRFFEMSFDFSKVEDASLKEFRLSIYKDVVQRKAIVDPKEAILFIFMLSIVSKAQKEKEIKHLDLSGYQFSKEQFKRIFKLCPFLKSLKINNSDLYRVEKYIPKSVEKLTLKDKHYLPRFDLLDSLTNVTELICENKLHNLLYQDWKSLTHLKEMVWVIGDYQEDALYDNMDKSLRSAQLPANLVSFVIQDNLNTIQTFKYHSKKNFLENLWAMIPVDVKDSVTFRYESPRFLLTARLKEGALDAYITIYGKNKTKLFQGVWSQDHLNGYGILHLSDGTQYRGVWDRGVLKRQGMRYTDGWQQTLDKTKLVFFNFITGIYVGDGREGKPEGEGVSYYLNGALWYKGQHSLGMRSGKGIEYYSKGSVKYEGKFTCDAPWGKGTFYYLDGSKAIGSFIDQKLEGEACLYDKKGQLVFKGLFKNGFKWWGREYYPKGCVSFEGSYSYSMKTGEGSEYYNNGSPKFFGKFKNNERDGEGNQYNLDGSILKGVWSAGRLIEGKKFDSSNEIRYEGSYLNEQREGHGTEFNKDGSKYVGSWSQGQREGFGTEFDPEERKVYEGTFKGNRYEGEGTLYIKGVPRSVVHVGGILQKEPSSLSRLYRSIKSVWKD